MSIHDMIVTMFVHGLVVTGIPGEKSMEIFLLIVAVLMALVIIGKLIGDPPIEKLDVAGLKREIWVTQNWINNYHKGGRPPKYQEKFQYKLTRLEQANAQLDKLTLHQTTKSGNAESVKPEEVEQAISLKLANDESYQDFLIVHSMRHLTDLASSQGLIQSQEEAHKYWGCFKDRIRNVHLNGKSATLDEVKSAVAKELAPVFQYSSVLVNDGMSEELALAQSIVNWYKNNKSLAQAQPLLPQNQLTEQAIADVLSNAERAYDEGDYAKAAVQYRVAAEQGVAVAQHNLGIMYDNGQGVPQDSKEAIKWWKLAAEQGYAEAQFNLGVIYERGDGAPQDFKKAIKWWKLAAKQGLAPAQYNLGKMYDNGQGVSQDSNEAIKWWKLVAEQGVAAAQHSLGVIYSNGRGVSQDYKEAAKWWMLAAEQGYADSQSCLGDVYNKGQGVPQDYTEAAKWWQQAAEQGCATAQHNLGLVYAMGRGVTQNLVLAHMWLNIAAAISDSEKQKISSIETRELAAKEMTASQIAEAQALAKKRIANNFKEC